ncbi:hypothetical protein CROQUDRAFT_666322 [Cronartium quercuum f. sp. fusiforme G11]|uniref:RecQ-mediated genome instability protein 1 n=1 Tax=Cronartium quercuum f. sp. fusiforme G11 TaxID=708437 RepID=A0A9P6N983_9BASI|nr:hypothetical protein CROQUDRAFT_666322 [Cronartium quercuum f. sp. fusiforme G11]
MVPSSLYSWFKSTYPTLTFEPTWIEQCCQYLQNHFDLTNSQLIKKVETQLLLSDLSCSVSSLNAPLPELLGSDRPFQSFPKEYLLPNGGILLQIQSITEIGYSALSLENTHQKKINEAKGRDRVLDLEDDEGLDRQAPIQFPRAMLKLELSDGHRTVSAIEYRRISALGLGITPLGCKLLVNNAKARRGMLLLTPENTIIKGLQVDELDAQRDQIFQTGLDFRLGRPIVFPDQPPSGEGPADHPNSQANNLVLSTSHHATQSTMITNTGPLNSRSAPTVSHSNGQARTSTSYQLSNVPSTSTSVTEPTPSASNSRSNGVSQQVIVIPDSDDEYDVDMEFEPEFLNHLP